MKTIYLFSILIIASLLASCSDDDNKKIIGKWQLRTVEYEGEVTKVDTVWYNFQSDMLFMYQLYDAASDSYIVQYGYRKYLDDNNLEMKFSQGYPFIDDTFLPYTDWKEMTRIFKILHIKGNKLILLSDDKTYTFRKF